MGLRVVHNPPPVEDETLSKLVTIVNNTCVTALDKTLNEVLRCSSFAAAGARTSVYCERICRASQDVRMCLPRPTTKGE